MLTEKGGSIEALAKALTNLYKQTQRASAAGIALIPRRLEYCHENNIGSFRINSQILPLKTHPEIGYEIDELPGALKIIDFFKACGAYSLKHDIRTTFHPDQFIVLSSNRPEVIYRSILDLEYQAQLAKWVNADVINIHAGGTYGSHL